MKRVGRFAYEITLSKLKEKIREDYFINVSLHQCRRERDRMLSFSKVIILLSIIASFIMLRSKEKLIQVVFISFSVINTR